MALLDGDAIRFFFYIEVGKENFLIFFYFNLGRRALIFSM